ncbi:MAG: adenylyltransferase/cytidyltransferase family protein [Thiomicrospira sp.]
MPHLKANNQTRVLALGVFDLFHLGHLNYLNFAKAQGDFLLVGVAPDAMCYGSKGRWPIIEQNARMRIVEQMKAVDEVRPVPTPIADTHNTLNWMLDWQVNKVVPGIEWQHTPRWQALIPLLNAHKIAVVFAPKTADCSTSEIISKIKQMGSP